MDNNIQNFDLTIFEVKDGSVNLTKICQHFDKKINDWTRTKTIKNFLAAFSAKKGDTNILVSVKGGDGQQGTWTKHREVAIKLAQWISPEFEVFCMEQLDQLFQSGKQPVKYQPVSTLELLQMNNRFIIELTKQNEKLEKETTLLASRDLEVKTQKEYKWKSQVVKADMGKNINYYVERYFYEGDYKLAHKKAKDAYRNATGRYLPDRIALASVELKRDYLLFLSQYAASQRQLTHA